MAKLIYDSTKNRDLFYAVKIDIVDPFFFLNTGGKSYVFLDHRDLGVFQEQNKNPDLEGVLLNPLLEEVRSGEVDVSPVNLLALLLLERYGVKGERLEVPFRFPLPVADFLREKGVELLVKDPFFPERARKTPEEIAAIRSVVGKIEQAFFLIEEILKNSTIEVERIMYCGEGLTSEFLKNAVHMLFLQQGLFNEDGIIISSGTQTAIPHHEGSGFLLPNQPIICDIYPRDRESGYVADLTRTFVKGEPSEELQKMYDAVLRSQEAGIAVLKPGAKASEVHVACAQALLEAGYEAGEKGFVHSAGHGIGLEVHELPHLGASSQDVLAPGNTVTVEPGLYYPEIGGIRLEDDFLITENGSEQLSRYPKDQWAIP